MTDNGSTSLSGELPIGGSSGLSLSGSILSSLNSVSSTSRTTDRGRVEYRKKSKKHKHHSKEKNRHKKRRHDSATAESSTVTNAENFQRYNVTDNVSSHRYSASSTLWLDKPTNQIDVSSEPEGQQIVFSNSATAIPVQNPPVYSTYLSGQNQIGNITSYPRYDMSGGYVPHSVPVDVSSHQDANRSSVPLNYGMLSPGTVPAILPAGVYPGVTTNMTHPPIYHQSITLNTPMPFPQLIEQQLQTFPESAPTDDSCDGVRNKNEDVILKSDALSSSSRSYDSTNNRICAQNTVSSVSAEELRSLFHMTIVEASKKLGMCTTLFKKICRKNNISKWPYRKINSLVNKKNSLEQYLFDGHHIIPDSVRQSYNEQIEIIKAKIEKIKNGAFPSSLKRSLEDDKTINAEDQIDNESQFPVKPQGKVSESTNTKNDHISKELSSKRKRHKTTYDSKTGWIANCSTCGKVGKYRNPKDGRVFQHSLGNGSYCGYYRDNPRKVGEEGVEVGEPPQNLPSSNTKS